MSQHRKHNPFATYRNERGRLQIVEVVTFRPHEEEPYPYTMFRSSDGLLRKYPDSFVNMERDAWRQVRYFDELADSNGVLNGRWRRLPVGAIPEYQRESGVAQ